MDKWTSFVLRSRKDEGRNGNSSICHVAEAGLWQHRLPYGTVRVQELGGEGHRVLCGFSTPRGVGEHQVVWSPDGEHLDSASKDHTVQIWDATIGRNVLTYRGHAGDTVASVAWSPDGKRIVSASIQASQVQV